MLAAFGDDPRQHRGEVGIVGILHTWGQTLVQHLHLPCMVAGGALARDGSQWLPAKRGFLFPVRALAPVFRGTFFAGLRRAFDRGALRLAGSVAELADPPAFRALLTMLRTAAWAVYAKPPFGGPNQVLEYLAGYSHRVALSNDRLVSLEDWIVRFRWRDYAHAHRLKTMALPGPNFWPASSSACSRTGSSASATSGSSPTGGGRPSSPGAVNSSRYRRLRSL